MGRVRTSAWVMQHWCAANLCTSAQSFWGMYERWRVHSLLIEGERLLLYAAVIRGSQASDSRRMGQRPMGRIQSL